jgi:hypothetical protein
MKNKNSQDTRPEVLDDGPLKYAPVNEHGVVFLFARMLKRLGISSVDKIGAGFPDCIAYKKTGKEEKKLRIEFEHKSKNFELHNHDPKKCDMIVCWEHNWPNAPKHLEIIELRDYFGLGFNVWIQPVNNDWKNEISRINYSKEWSVAKSAHKKDLILMYHNSPDKCIKDLFYLADNVFLAKGKEWEGDPSAYIRRVCHLDAPIFLEDLQNHRILKTAGFIRASMQGRKKATEYWPYLYDMIIKRNPSLKKILKKYSPENY